MFRKQVFRKERQPEKHNVFYKVFTLSSKRPANVQH